MPPQAAAFIVDVGAVEVVELGAAIGHELALCGVVELGRPSGRTAGRAGEAGPPAGASAAAPWKAAPVAAIARRLSAYPLSESRYG